MFHLIRLPVLKQMNFLEKKEAKERRSGIPRSDRLRQITPDTGKFLALLAAGAPVGAYLEIGTSAGYSALWINLACELLGRSLVTFEESPYKVDLARQTFQAAQVEKTVTLVEADARTQLYQFGDISFCFLDAGWEVYAECYEAIIPHLVKGGLLVADNAINRAEYIRPMLKRALSDDRVDSLIVPIGKGELVCRKL
jgi:caffeoyl-CoA O-methyltransferase